MFSANYVLCKLNKNSMENEVLKSRNNVRFLKILSLEGKLLEILLLLKDMNIKKGRKHTVFFIVKKKR